MKQYITREYSEEEINEILKNISSKLSRLNKNYNREYYNNMTELYNYLVNLKREKLMEKKLKEKSETEKNEYIETDPILKEYEKIMKEKLTTLESEEEDQDYSDDIY